MARRVLFACVECENALVWPVAAEPARDGELCEASFVESSDADGRPTIEVLSSERWKADLDPSGVVRCPEGHAVGTQRLNGSPETARLSLLRDRVVARQMRGRL